MGRQEEGGRCCQKLLFYAGKPLSFFIQNNYDVENIRWEERTDAMYKHACARMQENDGFPRCLSMFAKKPK
jgi:hypothetical protein